MLPVEQLDHLGLTPPTPTGGGGDAGAIGVVYPHPGDSSLVVKLFFPNVIPNAAVLHRLGALGHDPTVARRSLFAERLRLPVAVVTRTVGGMEQCCGFVMHDAGDAFRRTAHSFQTRVVLLEAQHLTHPDTALSLGLPVLDDAERLVFAALVLETVADLHDAGWLAQDMLSGKNVLYSNDPDVAVCFLDTDSMRPMNDLGVGPSAHSPGYDPRAWPPHRQCADSDVWKAAVLCGRVLAGEQAWPHVSDPASAGGPLLGPLLVQAAVDDVSQPRPTMRQLANVALRVAGVGSLSTFLPFTPVVVPARSRWIPLVSP